MPGGFPAAGGGHAVFCGQPGGGGTWPNAHSLNEPGQPGRQGATAEALRAELGAIVDWLAVD